MWWLEALVGVLVVLAFVLYFAKSESGSEEAKAVIGLVLVVLAVFLTFIDGSARQSQWECPVFNNNAGGLYTSTPYETVGSAVKDGERIFSFVRVPDGTNTAAVRCVQTKAPLPNKFTIGSGGKIVPLDDSPAK